MKSDLVNLGRINLGLLKNKLQLILKKKHYGDDLGVNKWEESHPQEE